MLPGAPGIATSNKKLLDPIRLKTRKKRSIRRTPLDKPMEYPRSPRLAERRLARVTRVELTEVTKKGRPVLRQDKTMKQVP